MAGTAACKPTIENKYGVFSYHEGPLDQIVPTCAGVSNLPFVPIDSDEKIRQFKAKIVDCVAEKRLSVFQYHAGLKLIEARGRWVGTGKKYSGDHWNIVQNFDKEQAGLKCRLALFNANSYANKIYFNKNDDICEKPFHFFCHVSKAGQPKVNVTSVNVTNAANKADRTATTVTAPLFEFTRLHYVLMIVLGLILLLVFNIFMMSLRNRMRRQRHCARRKAMEKRRMEMMKEYKQDLSGSQWTN